MLEGGAFQCIGSIQFENLTKATDCTNRICSADSFAVYLPHLQALYKINTAVL